MKITAVQDLTCRKGPESYFTGLVRIDEVIKAGAPSTFKVNRVSFEPGARTAWHTHPMGQALHVVSGVCRVQLEGEAFRDIYPGDSVWIEAGEKHWHGAVPGRTMVHLAIQESNAEGQDAIWGEHVTDQQYGATLE